MAESTEVAEAARSRKDGKNAHGEGCLFYVEKKGLWRASLMVGRKADGRPDRRYVSAKTQKECRAKLQELRQQQATASLADPHRLTVAAFLTDWLERTVRVRRRGSTYVQYESLLRVHVLPGLGGRPLKAVRAKDVDALYRALEAGASAANPKGKGRPTQGRGLSPKTIRGLHVALHAGFGRAVRLGLLPRNPADGVELPTAPRKRKLPVSLDDVQRLLHHSRERDARRWPLWAFLANTGARIGEAVALRWANVDLNRGWIRVAEDLDRDGAVDATKTETGEREIPLTAPALAALRAQRDRQDTERVALGDEYADRDLVFATSLGTPLSERNCLRDLKLAARAAGVPDAVCPHDLRRMTASVLVAEGVDLATAAAIMGHKNASVLLDVYAQALKAPMLAAARRLEGALYGPGGAGEPLAAG